MYGSRPRPRHVRPRPVGLLLPIFVASAASAQTRPDAVEPVPSITAVVPERIQLDDGPPRAHLHLEGRFPPPTYHLLSRLAVWASSGLHSCRLGWSRGPVEALLSRSGQPWLSQGDLLSESDNHERRGCGTIDGTWEDRLELTLHHPRLLSGGAVRIGIALYPVAEPGVATDGRPDPIAEVGIEIPVVESFRVLAQAPSSPVVAPGESLYLSFAVEGGPPETVEVAAADAWRPLRFDVSGDRISVWVPPALYRAPGHLSLRLTSGAGRIVVDVPVCSGGARSPLACPRKDPFGP